VDQTSSRTQPRITKLTGRGGKKHKDAAGGTRTADPDKRKRVWLPPGAGAFFG